MGIFSDLLGTSKGFFKLAISGVRLKNNAGNLAVRNSGDTADAEITASKLNNSGDSVVINSDAAGSGADWKITLQRPTSGMTADVALTLPVDDGTPSQVLTTDGSGVLSWTTPSGGGVSSFNTRTGAVTLLTSDVLDVSHGGGNVATNTALGTSALSAYTVSGAGASVAIGSNALAALTASGDTCTAIGANALMSMTTGFQCVAVGRGAVAASTNGSETVAVGTNALTNMTSGSLNTAIGSTCLNNVSSGANNTAAGAYCGNGITSGSHNVLIGYRAGQSMGNLSNSLVISAYSTTTPLITGSFDPAGGSAGSFDINGTFTVKGENVNGAIDSTALAFGSGATVAMFSTNATDIIESIEVIIDTAFDGTPTMSVGISGNTAKYMATTDNDLTQAARTVFQVHPGYDAQGAEALIITYSAGGATAGAARVLVNYATPA